MIGKKQQFSVMDREKEKERLGVRGEKTEGEETSLRLSP